VELDLIVEEMLPACFEVATDVFGNYLMQKLLQLSGWSEREDVLCRAGSMLRCGLRPATRALCRYDCTGPGHRRRLVSRFAGRMVELSTHAYGCRVVQRLVEVLEDASRLQILEELLLDNNVLLQCMQDQHGNHVRASPATGRFASIAF
jgi:pumilio RNA-binding family